MSVPPPALSAPSLSGSQRLAFKAGASQLIFGGFPIGVQKLEGLDSPSVRSGNVNWAMAPGSSPGQNQLDTRKITATIGVRQPFGTYGTFAGTLKAIAAARSSFGTAEYPLWAQLPSFPLVCCQARVINTSGFDWDPVADHAQILNGAAIQFEATDPYLYSAPTTTTTIGLAGPATGFHFPLSFPLTFGGSLTPNTATITNNGDATCWPTLIVTGPCLNPTVANGSITGNPTIQTAITLNAGDTLTIDCNPSSGSVVYQPSGGIAQPMQYVLQPGSEMFGLLPQGVANQITFNSADTSTVSGTLNVYSADTYDALI